MKYSYLLLVASIGLLAACSGLEQPESDLFMDMEGDLVEKVVFDVLPIKDGDDPETRASAVPTGSGVSFAWEVTDTVGIFPKKGSQVFFSMESGVGTSSASFDGGDWALKQGSSYVSYYPLVGEFYLDRTKIPVSFAGQKQIGISSPFHGARYFLATELTSSKNGVLQFSYSTLNTIINVNATLPAGTYTKASLTIKEPLFVEEGTYSLDDRVIVGTEFTNTLEIELEDIILTEEGTIPIYIMSAPVDLKDKEVTVMVFSSDGNKYVCIKKPSKAYAAGTRYGLTCDKMQEVSIINFADPEVKAICVANWDTDGDGELDMDEAAAVTELPAYGSDNMFRENKNITSFDELQYFTGLSEIRYGAFMSCSNLVSITLPESITAIRGMAFDGCSELASLDIPKSIRSIEAYAFGACSSLTHFDIPEGAEIDWTTLNGTSIESIIIPTCTFVMRADVMLGDFRRHVYGECISSVTYSGSLSGTSMVVNLRSSLTTLYFDRKFSLTNDPGDGFIGGTDYPDNNLSSIAVSSDNLLFDSRDNCNALINTATNTLLVGAKTTAIPESVSAIAPSAFIGLNYSSPFSITVPASVENIGNYAFMPHPSSSFSYSVTFLASEPPTLGDGCFGFDTENENLNIYVPTGSVTAYKNADGWSDYTDRIFASEPMVAFQDSAFKAYCVDNFDTNNDGNISYSEAAVVEEINVWSLSISSLEGIESFTNLRTLYCGNNELSLIDISKNALLQTLECSDNHLTSLDVSANTRLTWLECRNNEISSIDISNNIELDFFRCSNNPITEIDFSKNKKLSYIDFELCQLSTIDVSNNTWLSSLYCMGNNITSLDVSNNEELSYLDISWTPITSVYLENNRRLRSLFCQHTLLSTLDISKNINLLKLWCDDNPQLKDIWLSTGQSIDDFVYDDDIVTIHYKS